METEEQSRSIEDIIKARIKEETWDDVVRKQALQPGRFKPKQAALSTEKSTEGLGEIYAREYEQEILGARPADETNKAHEVARELFAKLSARLDQLTSFHFVPKPFQGTEAKVRANPNPNPNTLPPTLSLTPTPTLPKVRANVPAVSLEEKMPVSMATADTLAPEEVYAAKRRGSMLKGLLPPWQCLSSPPLPPRGAPGGSGQLGTPRVRPSH